MHTALSLSHSHARTRKTHPRPNAHAARHAARRAPLRRCPMPMPRCRTPRTTKCRRAAHT
eukprot:5994051-Pleurochrysis_carterae.AAC.1